MIDISKTVKELVAFVAEKFRIATSIGYSLYGIAPDKSHLPLDFDLSLPQQIQNYDTVVFKRRFFLLTKKHIAGRASALSVFNDIKIHFANVGYKIGADQRRELLYYSLYAGLAPNEDAQRRASAMPGVPADDRQALLQLVKSRKAPTVEEAIEEYVTIVHTIPNFGSETYQIKYAVGEDKMYLSADIIIGPRRVEIVNAEATVYSLPYFQIVSIKDNPQGVTLKCLMSKGEELVLKIRAKTPRELQSALSGYASITKDIGVELLTDGFVKEETGAGADTMDPALKAFYVAAADGTYPYFPGTTAPFQAAFAEFSARLPPEVSSVSGEIQKLLETCAEDLFEQEAVLNLIAASARLFADERLQVISPPETAVFTLSSFNITPARLAALVDLVDIVLRCQKALRREVSIRASGPQKAMIQSFLAFLQQARAQLAAAVDILRAAPADGAILLGLQTDFITLYGGIQELLAFATTVVQLPPGSPQVPAIEQASDALRTLLRPLIPNESPDRLAHIVQIHKLLFSVAIVLAMSGALLQDAAIVANESLREKLTEVTTALAASFMRLHELRILLLTRPFSEKLLQDFREQTFVCQKNLLICRSTADIVVSLTDAQHYTKGISLARGYLSKTLAAFDACHIELYREVPSGSQVKALYDALAETLPKTTGKQPKLAGDPDRALWAELSTSLDGLKEVTAALKEATAAPPTRAVFKAIARGKTVLTHIMNHVRELSSMLQDASLFHYFNKGIRLVNQLLVGTTPSFATFHKLIGEFEAQLGAVTQDLKCYTGIVQNWERFRTARAPDREMVYIVHIRELLVGERGSAAPDRKAQLDGVIDYADLLVTCSGQLGLFDAVETPALMLIPFFKGKELDAMINDFITQTANVSRWFDALLRTTAFSPVTKNAVIVNYWKEYFAQMGDQLQQLRQQEGVLVSRLRDVTRKQVHVDSFLKVVANSFIDAAPAIKQLGIFFGNSNLVLEAITQPHVAPTDTARFAQILNPLIHQAQKALARSTSRKPNVAQRISQMQKILSSGVSKINTGNVSLQQAFADNVFDAAEEFIKVAGDDLVLRGATDAVIVLQTAVADFTMKAVSDINTAGTGRGISSCIPPETIKALVAEAVRAPITEELAGQVLMLVQYVTQDIPSLAAPAGLAILSIGLQPAYTIAALRALVQTQASLEVRTEQFRELAIEFAVRAAQYSGVLKEIIPTLPIDSPVVGYFVGHIMALLKAFDPQVLIESRSFPTVSLAYSSLKDIRTVLPLLLREVSVPALAEAGAFFIEMSDQMDMSLAVYFANTLEALVRSALTISKLVPESRATERIVKLAGIWKAPAMLLWPNFVALGATAKELQLIEEGLHNTMRAMQTRTSDQARAQFALLKDFRLILSAWANPMTELFVVDSLPLQVRSLLREAAERLQFVGEALACNIVMLPAVYSRPAARLSELIAVILAAKWRQPEVAAKFEPMVALLEQVEAQCGLLTSETKAHKADAALQELLPQLIALVAQLLAESEAQAIDWQQKPKAIGVISQRQIDNVLFSVEATPVFDLAKLVCAYLTDLVGDREVPPGTAKLLSNMIDMIPLYGNMPFDPVRAQLGEVVDAVLADVNAPPEAILPQIARAIAAAIRVLPQSSPEVIALLGVSPVRLMDHLVDLASGDPEKARLARLRIADDFGKLRVFLTAAVDRPEAVRASAVDALVAVADGVAARDAGAVHAHALFLDALQAAALRDGAPDALIGEVRPLLLPVAAAVASAAHGLSGLPDLRDARAALVERLTAEWLKSAYAFERCETLAGLLDIGGGAKVTEPLLDDARELADVRRLLAAGADVQIMAVRALALSRQRSVTKYAEFVKLAALAARALPAIVATRSELALRGFRRYGTNIADIVEDLFLARDAPAHELAGFKALQWDALVLVAQIFAVFAFVNTARAATRLDDAWRLVQGRRLPAFNALTAALPGKVAELLKTNSRAAEAEAARRGLAALAPAAADFARALDSPDIARVIAAEAAAAEALSAVALAVVAMTDAVVLSYDTENAAKLPARFGVPPIPGDAAGKPQATAAALLAAIEKITAGFPDFRERITQPIPNAALVAVALPFYAEVTELLLHTLRLSLVSFSLSNQLELTAGASALAKVVDVLNRGLKAKCLANPAWAADSERALNDFLPALAAIRDLAQTARQIAEEEDAKQSEVRAKFFAVLTPLRALLPKLETNQKILAARDPSPACEMSAVLLKLVASEATLMGRILLHAKEQGRDGAELESSLVIGGEVLALGKTIVDLTRGDVPPLESLLALSAQVVALLQRFRGEVDPRAPEAADLAQQAELLVQGAQGLEATVKRAIEAPPPTVKPKAPARPPGLSKPPGLPGQAAGGPPDAADETAKRGASKAVSLVNSKESQDRLMTRLELESRVNMWRWRLEFLEKELAAIGA